MKKLYYKLLALGISLGVMIALAVMINCSPAKESGGCYYEPTITVESEEMGVAQYYSSINYFCNHTSPNTPFYIGHDVEAGSVAVCYVDVRAADGSSTWDNPRHERTILTGDISTLDDPDPNPTFYIRPFLTIAPTAPPLYLHLVAKTWDDMACEYKAWKMSEVQDEYGYPVTDPDLVNFTDDQIYFYKGTKVMYAPGPKRSDAEKDILEGAEKSYYYGNYTITGNEEDGLIINVKPADGEGQMFEVLESTYSTLRLRATRDGDVGYLTLVRM